jgi:opacity protein-like surface antigen
MLAGGLNNTVGEIDVPSANRTNFTPFARYEFSTDWEQPVRLELAYLAGEVSQNSTLNTTMTSGWVDSGKFIQNLPVSVQRQQKTRVSTLMLNGYYDYTTGTPFTPYITGGVGVALLKNAASLSQSSAGLSFSSDTFSQNNTQMAWSLGAGVAWGSHACSVA